MQAWQYGSNHTACGPIQGCARPHRAEATRYKAERGPILLLSLVLLVPIERKTAATRQVSVVSDLPRRCKLLFRRCIRPGRFLLLREKVLGIHLRRERDIEEADHH